MSGVSPGVPGASEPLRGGELMRVGGIGRCPRPASARARLPASGRLMASWAVAMAGAFALSRADAGSESVKSVEAAVRCLTDQGKIPGAVTLIARDGKLIFASAVGFQDVAARAPMTQATIFRLYSMSKPITSVAIMMLMERGQLRLDDPIYRYIPAFKDARVYAGGDVDHLATGPLRRAITIQDLLTHTSGLTYHFTGDTPVQQYYRKHGVKRNTPVGSLPTDAPAATTLEELVNRLAHAPLLHQPGERFDYSYSTTVLGYIVERVSGMRLDRFLQQRLFTPLGMTHTGFFVEGADLEHFATNYQWTQNGLASIETNDTTDYRDRDRLLDGGGALAATAADYLRFAQMLANGGELHGVRILRPATVALMFEDHLPASANTPPVAPGMQFQFGYGFAIGDASTARAGLLPEGAAGWDGSANTFFWVDRARRLVTVFMTQVIEPNGPAVLLKKVIYRAVYDGQTAPAANACK